MMVNIKCYHSECSFIASFIIAHWIHIQLSGGGLAPREGEAETFRSFTL